MNETYSNLRIFKHPAKIEALQRGIVSAPIMARIKPTNVCDQFCFYCSTPIKATYVQNAKDEFIFTDSIPWDILKDTINKLADMGTKSIIFSGGGEPLVYPHIEDAMKLVLDRGLDLALITNGWKLNGTKAKILKDAKWVRLSIDCFTADDYASFRKIPKRAFVQVCENIIQFNNIRKGKLGINYVVHNKNYNQIYATAVLFDNLGVDNIKFAPLIYKDNPVGYHDDFKEDVIKSIIHAQHTLNNATFSVVDKYSDSLHTSTVFNRQYSKCPTMQIVTSIAANCKVYLCHDKAYMKGNELGNLKEKSFNNIWFSAETKQLFETFNARERCRHHCVWDIRNKIILNYLDIDDEEENFI